MASSPTAGGSVSATAMVPSTSNSKLTIGHERRMRCMYLTRVTCDGILRDLVSDLCKYKNTTWEKWAQTNEEYLMKYHSYTKLECDSDGVPLLSACDTTFLAHVLRKLTKNDKYLSVSKTLSDLRNDVSHATVDEMSETEYDTKFNNLEKKVLQISSNCSSLNVQKHLDFLRENKADSFQSFCSKFPVEMKAFIATLESQKFLPLVEGLVTKVDAHEKVMEGKLNEQKADLQCLQQLLVDQHELTKKDVERLDLEINQMNIEGASQKIVDIEGQMKVLRDKTVEVEQSVEHLIKKRANNKHITLPSSNIPELPTLCGRDSDLTDLERSVNLYPVTLVSGPPGIGKTSLALRFAESYSSTPYTCCLYVEFRNVSTKGKSNDDIRKLISRTIGKQFPAITPTLTKADDPFDILQRHILDVVEDLKLLLVLDNVDDILLYQKDSLLEDIIKNLSSSSKRVKFLCTARLKDMNASVIEMGYMTLGPISNSVCEDWMMTEVEQFDVGSDLIKSVVSHCRGIPLIMKILASGIKRNWITEEDDLPVFKESSDDWSRLKASLQWSFSKLDENQLRTMQCASIFVDYFDKHTIAQLYNYSKQSWFQKFRKLFFNDSDVFSFAFLNQCTDLSLLEFERTNKLYFCHPYIQEYTHETYPQECAQLTSHFFVVYFSKLLDLTKTQMIKSQFVATVKVLLKDLSNYQRFLKIQSKDVTSEKVLLEFCVGDQLSYYWLLASFWFLDKLTDTQHLLLHFAYELERIFSKMKLSPHLSICKAFLSHQLRLKGEFDKAKLQLNEASNVLTNKSPEFTRGYVFYSMGRYIQQLNGKERSSEFTWSKDYPWESRDLALVYNDAVELYSRWKEPVASNPQKGLITFKEIVEIETIEILSQKYRQDIEMFEDDESKVEGILTTMEIQVERLKEILGDHGESGYAIKKFADLLWHSGKTERAASMYEEAYKMNEALSPTTGVSKILILKNWALCIAGTDPKVALLKLELAEKHLEKNYMTGHEWADRVRKAKDKVQNFKGGHGSQHLW